MAYDYYTVYTSLGKMEETLVFKKRLLNSFTQILNRSAKGLATLIYEARPGWLVLPISTENNLAMIKIIGYSATAFISLNLHADDVKKYYVKVIGPGFVKLSGNRPYHLKFIKTADQKYNASWHANWRNYYNWNTKGLNVRISDVQTFIAKLQTTIANKKVILAREAARVKEAAEARAREKLAVARIAETRRLQAELTAQVAEQQALAAQQAAMVTAARAREVIRDKEITIARAREATRAKEIAAARVREAARAKDIAAARAREAATAKTDAIKSAALQSQKEALVRSKEAAAVQSGIKARQSQASAAAAEVSSRVAIVEEAAIKQEAVADKIKNLIAPIKVLVERALAAEQVDAEWLIRVLKEINIADKRVSNDPYVQRILKKYENEILEKAKELSPEDEAEVVAKANKKGTGTLVMIAAGIAATVMMIKT